MVYGSLKRGQINDRALAEAEFLGRCYLEGKYRMLDLGWFPAVVEHNRSSIAAARVYGEVYLVDEDTLYTLDCIEGHPSFYARRKVDTPFKKAWCYFLPEEELDRERTVVESGLWKPLPEELEYWRAAV
jgi:gamma-glutamylaminecyclotransferase